MGIDKASRGSQKLRQRSMASADNLYVQLASKAYKVLERRTDSKFNAVISKRLMFTGRNKAAMSLSKLAELVKGKEAKTAVVVGTVTDDVRLAAAPKVTVCALRFTETARARIEKAGGACLSFDQVAIRHPEGKGCLLLRGATKARVQEKYFGKAPGVPDSTTRPHVRRASNLKRKGRKHENARGRRGSRGFKV